MQNSITRTGKPKYDPRGSDLYAKNPAPPAKYLPRKCDYRDAAGNLYFDALQNKKLAAWVEQSPLKHMISPDFQQASTMLRTECGNVLDISC